MAKKKIEKDDIKIQQQIPGTESPRNPKLEKLAKSYRAAMLARKSAGEEEHAAHETLMLAMTDAGVTVYQHGDMEIRIDEKRKVRVKVKTQSPDDGDDDE